jgi:acyl-CoA thioester hydrolase
MPEFTRTITVRWADVDANRHLRHSAYADYATHMRMEWLKEIGFLPSHLAELALGPILFEEHIVYRREILLGESIRIDLELVGRSEDHAKWHFRQHFYKEDGALAAKYEVKGAWLDVVNRRLTAPPRNLTAAVEDLRRSDDYAEIPTSHRVTRPPVAMAAGTAGAAPQG